jgi:hypothetical protein
MFEYGEIVEVDKVSAINASSIGDRIGKLEDKAMHIHKPPSAPFQLLNSYRSECRFNLWGGGGFFAYYRTMVENHEYLSCCR